MSSLSDALIALAGGAAGEYNKSKAEERQNKAAQKAAQAKMQAEFAKRNHESKLKRDEAEFEAGLISAEGAAGRESSEAIAGANRESTATTAQQNRQSRERVARADRQATASLEEVKHTNRVKEASLTMMNEFTLKREETRLSKARKSNQSAKDTNANAAAFEARGDFTSAIMERAKHYGEVDQVINFINNTKGKSVAFPERWTKDVPVRDDLEPTKFIRNSKGMLEPVNPKAPTVEFDKRQQMRKDNAPVMEGTSPTSDGGTQLNALDQRSMAYREQLEAMLVDEDVKGNWALREAEAVNPETGQVEKLVTAVSLDKKTGEVGLGGSVKLGVKAPTSAKDKRYDTKGTQKARDNFRQWDFSSKVLTEYSKIASASQGGIVGAGKEVVATVKANIAGVFQALGREEVQSLNQIMKENFAEAGTSADRIASETADWEFLKGMNNATRVAVVYAIASSFKESTRDRINNADVENARKALTGAGLDASAAGALATSQGHIRIRQRTLAKDSYLNENFDPGFREEAGRRYLAMQRDEKNRPMFQFGQDGNAIVAKSDHPDGDFNKGDILIQGVGADGEERAVPLRDYILSQDQKLFNSEF